MVPDTELTLDSILKMFNDLDSKKKKNPGGGFLLLVALESNEMFSSHPDSACFSCAFLLAISDVAAAPADVNTSTCVNSC